MKNLNNTLMSLAVCNMVDKQAEFESKITLSEEISEMCMPIVKSKLQEEEKRRKDYDDKKLNFKITSEIKTKRDNINELKKIKTQKILIMLGQMYNGVIVPKELSVRRGQFHRYRCQYTLSLGRVKDVMLKNLHLVGEKITNEKNLDILEYCLDVWDREKDREDNNNRNDDRKSKSFNFDELSIIEVTDCEKDNPNTSFDITFVNGVSVYDNGDIKFFYKQNNEKDNQSFETENFNSLYYKFEDEIKQLSKDFIDELDREIKKRTDKLEEIKLKGSHLLMSAEIQKGSGDVEGYGNNI